MAVNALLGVYLRTFGNASLTGGKACAIGSPNVDIERGNIGFADRRAVFDARPSPCCSSH